MIYHIIMDLLTTTKVFRAFHIILKMPLIVFLCANNGLDRKCLPHMKHVAALNNFFFKMRSKNFFRQNLGEVEVFYLKFSVQKYYLVQGKSYISLT
jgi:hypothetical protein